MSAVRLLLLCILAIASVQSTRYEPNWKSIDSRPLPGWYDDAKVGVFLHWGVFAVPSFGSEWFWNYWRSGSAAYVNFMKENYRPGFTYADFGPQFRAEFYDPDEWAELIEASGAKYLVLTSKHHDGFCNWPSPVSWNWNSMDVGPKRDLVGDLAKSIRTKTKVKFGLYHSLFEWFNPLYLKDKQNKYQTDIFVKRKAMPELYELVNNYKPEVIWSDGDWEASATYWNSTTFLAWLYNDSPVKDSVVVNDRWGSGCSCHHGGYYTCQDRYNPGKLQPHKWENAMTIDKGSWGYRRNVRLSDYLTSKDIIDLLAETVSCGGNLLVNAGPTADGRILPIFEERLRDMGAWLKLNGEAIYETKPWTHQNDTVTPNIWYTSSKDGKSVYGIVLDWPTGDDVMFGAVQAMKQSKVAMIGFPGELSFKTSKKGTAVEMPEINPLNNPSDLAWVFKFQMVKPARMRVKKPKFGFDPPKNNILPDDKL